MTWYFSSTEGVKQFHKAHDVLCMRKLFGRFQLILDYIKKVHFGEQTEATERLVEGFFSQCLIFFASLIFLFFCFHVFQSMINKLNFLHFLVHKDKLWIGFSWQCIINFIPNNTCSVIKDKGWCFQNYW